MKYLHMQTIVRWHNIKAELRALFLDRHQIEGGRLQDHYVRHILNDVVGQLRHTNRRFFDLKRQQCELCNEIH